MHAVRGVHGPVVAGIDLTDDTDEVLVQADAIAASLKTNLIVCHVLHEWLHARMLFPQLAAVDRGAQATLETRAREAVEARVAGVLPSTGTHIAVTLDSGSAHAGILNQIDRTGAGLAVLGPGHVAQRVARYAPCAVLVARATPRGSVLGATDFSDPSQPAIETAAAEARRRRVPLRLLHCLEFSEPVLLGSSSVAIGVVPALPGELVDELERDARDRLHAALERTGMNGECLVTRGTAAASIVNAATEVATELVVIGMRGRSNLSRLLLGSVAESVLPTAPCSVMVVHLAR